MAGMTADKLEVAQSDREAAAATIPDDGSHSSYMAVNAILQGHADDWPLVQAFARHRHAAHAEAVTFLAKAAHVIAWQAGVGGRETAGAIVSYLATAPDEIAAFFADKLSPIDFAGDWMRGGCLSWHGADGKVWTPEKAAAAKAALATEPSHAE